MKTNLIKNVTLPLDHSTLSLAIVGFGSQAKAWALNLRDSGYQVTVVARNIKSANIKLAAQLGFNFISSSSAELAHFTHLALLIPDQEHQNFLNTHRDYLHPKCHLIFAHGYSIQNKIKGQYNDGDPLYTYTLIAPKAIASELRFRYETKGNLGAVFYSTSTRQKAIESAIHIAKAIGITALYESTAKEETLADLFSEQSLLCSLLPYASLATYNQLRKNGISKELAFMECFLELRSIATALVNLGPTDFFKLISPNALIGSEIGRKSLVNREFQQKLELIFENLIKDKINFTNSDAIRKEVLDFWQKEELSKVYENLKGELV